MAARLKLGDWVGDIDCDALPVGDVVNTCEGLCVPEGVCDRLRVSVWEDDPDCEGVRVCVLDLVELGVVDGLAVPEQLAD